MFLITGITGRTGGAAATKLLQQGHTVRAVVRDPAKAAEWAAKGVELRQGEYTDAVALASALKGVEGAYLMLPPQMTPEPGFPEAKAMIAAYVEALTRTPVPAVVALSSIGSEKDEKLGLITQTHLLEEALNRFEFPVAYVRAASFYENLTYGLGMAAGTGNFDTFLAPVERPAPMIGTVDIGNEVARLLTSSWSGKKIVELGSEVTPKEAGDAIGAVIGKPVVTRAIPREHWEAALQGMGFPAGKTGAFQEMWESFNDGWIHFGVAGTEAVPATLGIEEFFRKEAAK